jgi:hypothetical protein
LANASVVTDLNHPEIVQNGGPPDVQDVVKTLNKESASTECTMVKLSTGVQLISKPSKMELPPWQVVSAKLDGAPLRVASWWDYPRIYSTPADVQIDNWPVGLKKPGRVDIATSGRWIDKEFGLKGGKGKDFNHAKIAVGVKTTKPICIFGDLNQQGAVKKSYASPGQTMASSQNGRGGLFYVVESKLLHDGITHLLQGDTADTTGPNKK